MIRKLSVTVAGVLCGCVATAWGLYQSVPTWLDCWNDYEGETSQCCTIEDQGARKECLDTVAEGLKECLDTLPLNTPLPNCYDAYKIRFLACMQNPPCSNSTQDSKAACWKACKNLYLWCKGRTGPTHNLESTPIWVDPPADISACGTRDLTTITNDPDIVAVQFEAIRADADESDPHQFFFVGSAHRDTTAGNLVVWTLTVDSCIWPTDESDHTIVVLAQAMAVRNGRRTIWDLSDPLELQLQH